MGRIDEALSKVTQFSGRARRALPYIGIVAFAASSVNALGYFFIGHAQHKSNVYWAAAILVEGFTAWLVSAAVGEIHHLTRSRISEQDRRFHRVIFGLYVGFLIPTLAVSCFANYAEFRDSFWLGVLFPSLCVACAAGAAMPSTVASYEARRQEEKEKAKREREEKQAEKEYKQRESNETLFESLGSAGATLALYFDHPQMTQKDAAQELGISRQAVGQHLRKLEQVGAIRRNGKGIEVLIDVHSGQSQAAAQAAQEAEA